MIPPPALRPSVSQSPNPHLSPECLAGPFLAARPPSLPLPTLLAPPRDASDLPPADLAPTDFPLTDFALPPRADAPPGPPPALLAKRTERAPSRRMAAPRSASGGRAGEFVRTCSGGAREKGVGGRISPTRVGRVRRGEEIPNWGFLWCWRDEKNERRLHQMLSRPITSKAIKSSPPPPAPHASYSHLRRPACPQSLNPGC